MKRKELIAQLAQAGPLTSEQLDKLPDHQLQALTNAKAPDKGVKPADGGTATPAPASNKEMGADGTAPKAEGAPQPTGQDTTNKSAPDTTATEIASLKELLVAQGKQISQLIETTAPAVQEKERERQQLVEELAGNARVPFDKADLEAKPLVELRKLRAMARGEDYAARGGPHMVPAANREEEFLEPKPYWAQANNADNGGKKEDK